VGLPATVLAKKAPLPPSDFETRALTGSTELERRITDAIALGALSEEELQELKTAAQEDGQAEARSRYIAALVGRDRVQDAITFLHDRSWADQASMSRLADVFDLAMGQLRWGACAQIALTRLERNMSRAVFLIRALCLQRAGDPEQAMENFEAAHSVEAFDREIYTLLKTQLVERGAGNQLPPASDEIYRPLSTAFTQSPALEQLFVYHLTGRKDAAWLWGTIQWGGFGASELRQVILSRSRSYRYCHEAAMRQGKRRKKGLSGSTTIVWRIDALGRVVDPKLVDPDWGGHEGGDWLNACLVDQVKRLQFPRTAYGLPMPARHRFVYKD